ncbi:MAG TPA: 16S rRNA (cytosine(1402)-N(4))-methyltransferase RsmH [Candidatus Saccharimonadales bacterium]|nr:16S rRNA (cytosine(1402)-N(4))-methyltransferase RsmH [Candidatus Saccharimonadales bacterium]
MEYQHVPVMLTEVLELLNVKLGGRYLDGTLGGAGYTIAIAKKSGAPGKVLSIDLDASAINNANLKIKDQGLKNITVVSGNFKNLSTIATSVFGKDIKFDGIVFDLGLSSFQLDDTNRGFSFKGDSPLDMAFGSEIDNETVNIVNKYPLLELTRIFREYGEEKMAYQIAQAIVETRKLKKINTTADLVAIIEARIPFRFRRRLHPATRVFQALRMETNEELKNLSEVLPQALTLLAKNGRLVVVSFHSGEDRIVKRFLKNNPAVTVITKRPLIPSAQEAAENPRARSAKLRAAAKN